MLYSQTVLNSEKTNETRISFDYIVWEFIKPTRISVPRKAFNSLLTLTAKRMSENEGIIGSVRDLAKWAINGCPCNLADELGFSDPNQIYAIFRYWDGIEAINRSGHCIKAPNESTNSGAFRKLARIAVA